MSICCHFIHTAKYVYFTEDLFFPLVKQHRQESKDKRYLTQVHPEAQPFPRHPEAKMFLFMAANKRIHKRLLSPLSLTTSFYCFGKKSMSTTQDVHGCVMHLWPISFSEPLFLNVFSILCQERRSMNGQGPTQSVITLLKAYAPSLTIQTA